MLAPPSRELPSKWVQENRVLFGESSAAAGRLSLDRTPYAREVLDSLTDLQTQTVVLRWASQVGKSEALLSALCWMVAVDPGPALFVVPSTAMAQAFSRDRIGPMFARTPALSGLVAENKSRDSDNTTFRKRYLNGQLTIVSANSTDGLVGRPIRFLFADEIDRMEANAGGDPIAQATQRTASFALRKVFLSGTPLLAGFSRIDEHFSRGDQRHWNVPCLGCGELQPLVWEQVEFRSWDDTRYVCRGCSYAHDEHERRIIVGEGDWIASNADGEPGVRSYHLNALASLMPGASMNALARTWKDVHKKPESRRTFLNEKLALSWEEEGDSALAGDPVRVTTDRLAVPVVATTDVQGDRLETTLLGVEGDQLIVLDHIVLYGDVALPHVWSDLDRLREEWGVRAHAIDCGYLQEVVLQYVQSRRREAVFAVKGEAAGIGNAPVKARATRPHRGSVPIRLVNVDECKLRVQTRVGTSALVFADHLGAEYFDQLASEKLVPTIRRGIPVKVWRRREGTRNEALDCLAYAIGLLEMLRGRLPTGKFAGSPEKFGGENKTETPEEPKPKGLNRYHYLMNR